jgi:hypothetical protein
MANGKTRWRAAALGLSLCGFAGLLSWWVATDSSRKSPESAAEGGQPGRGPAFAPGAVATTDPAASPPPETHSVEDAMNAWRSAIVIKNADTVVTLDRIFLDRPDIYMAALIKSAETDPEERVRAFSTRVLGKLASGACSEVFVRLLRDKSPYVRQNAAWGLEQLGNQVATRELARQAADDLHRIKRRDPSKEVRAAATAALGKMM